MTGEGDQSVDEEGKMQEPLRYDAVAISLHWLTALAVIGLLLVGPVMADLERTDPLRPLLFGLHKSFGIFVLLATLFRLAWRLSHRPPALPATLPGWESRLIHFTHRAFYALLLAVPLLGWAMNSSGKEPAPMVLFGAIPWPLLPVLPDLAPEIRKPIHDFCEGAHGAVAYLMAGLLALHVAAALRHRFLRKDGLAERMLPEFRKR
jgi:cytochrome b561